MNRDDQDNCLKRVSDILLWCFAMTFALLLISFLFYLAVGDEMYCIHAKWFQISRHDFALVYYCSMAILKLCAFVVFLFPGLSIRIALRKGAGADNR
jgi:hypothetical protein